MDNNRIATEKEKVLVHVSDVIRIASREIKRQKAVKSDQMRQLTGLVNAFTRLSGANEEPLEVNPDNGDPNYYDENVANVEGE